MTKYLITYDIKSNKLRKKVSDLLIRYGYERIQYSVLCGLSKSSNLKSMKSILNQMDFEVNDSIIIIPFSKINTEIKSNRISSLELNKEVIVI